MNKSNQPGIVLHAVMHYGDDHEKFTAFFLDKESADLLAAVKHGFGESVGKVISFFIPINVSVSNMQIPIVENLSTNAHVEILNKYHGNLMLSSKVIEPLSQIYGTMDDAKSDPDFWNKWGEKIEQVKLYKSGIGKLSPDELEALKEY